MMNALVALHEKTNTEISDCCKLRNIDSTSLVVSTNLAHERVSLKQGTMLTALLSVVYALMLCRNGLPEIKWTAKITTC